MTIDVEWSWKLWLIAFGVDARYKPWVVGLCIGPLSIQIERKGK